MIKDKTIICVYQIKNLKNNKVFIGQTVDFNERWRQHKMAAKRKQRGYLYRVMNEEGIENFEATIIKQCPIEDLNMLETFCIIAFCSFDRKYGYNRTFGGRGNPKIKWDKRIKSALKGKNFLLKYYTNGFNEVRCMAQPPGFWEGSLKDYYNNINKQARRKAGLEKV